MNLVLDLDETLITNAETCKKYGFSNMLPIVVEIMKEWHEIIYIRPFINDFLEWCNGNFEKVILCTYGSKKRVSILLRELELKKYFDEVYVYDDICSNKLEIDDFVLVDDCKIDSSLMQEKMKFLGIEDDKNIIKISKFEGKVEDRELLNLQKVLEEKLGV